MKPIWPIALLLLAAVLAPSLINSTFVGAIHQRITQVFQEWK